MRYKIVALGVCGAVFAAAMALAVVLRSGEGDVEGEGYQASKPAATEAVEPKVGVGPLGRGRRDEMPSRHDQELEGSEPDADPSDHEWDSLSPTERVTQLETDFSRALADLRVGGSSPEVLARAQGALSELRAQLYPVEGGRERHARLEEKLREVTDAKEAVQE